MNVIKDLSEYIEVEPKGVSRRRTKVVATLGPSLDDEAMMLACMAQGMNVVRVNYAHGAHEDHARRVAQVRALQKDRVAILADIPGPKVRIGTFPEGGCDLNHGDVFFLHGHDATLSKGRQGVVLEPEYILSDLKPGQELLLSDGLIILEVVQSDTSMVETKVIQGGHLRDRQGVNLKQGGLNLGAITEEDWLHIDHAVSLCVDYIALSFVRDVDDVLMVKKHLAKAKSKVSVIVKIERLEVLSHLDEVIAASDGVMVARGDLAIEIGNAQVPAIQKQIIKKARYLNRPVITATQMMESMIHQPLPTRAEVSDVANAVLDGTDAVMLSAETAIGDFPEHVMKQVNKACLAVERYYPSLQQGSLMHTPCEAIDETIAKATVFASQLLSVAAVVCLTESGTTPLLLSRMKTGIPILALSRHDTTLGKVNLYRDVIPVFFDPTKVSRAELNCKAIGFLVKQGLIASDARVILTKGDVIGAHGGTNALKIIDVAVLLGA